MTTTLTLHPQKDLLISDKGSTLSFPKVHQMLQEKRPRYQGGDLIITNPLGELVIDEWAIHALEAHFGTNYRYL